MGSERMTLNMAFNGDSMASAAPLEELVEDSTNVLSESNPFMFVNVNGPHRFPASNRIVLERGPWPNRAGNGGELFLIVKPGWECEMKIRVENLGFFTGSLGREAVQDEYPVSAFGIDFTRFAEDGGRSIYFTARGGSMIAISSDGIRPLGQAWSASDSGDYFALEAENRGIADPTRFKDGILLSLTAPYGNYEDPTTYSLIFNDPGSDVELTVITATNVQAASGQATVPSIAPEEGGVARPGDEPGGLELIETAAYGDPIVIAEGVDVDGQTWSVDIREDVRSETWSVFVDGVMKESGLSQEEATTRAAGYAKAREAMAEISDDNKPKTTDPAIPWLGIVAGIVVVVLIVVGVSSFAKGAGEGAARAVVGGDSEE